MPANPSPGKDLVPSGRGSRLQAAEPSCRGNRHADPPHPSDGERTCASYLSGDACKNYRKNFLRFQGSPRGTGPEAGGSPPPGPTKGPGGRARDSPLLFPPRPKARCRQSGTTDSGQLADPWVRERFVRHRRVPVNRLSKSQYPGLSIDPSRPSIVRPDQHYFQAPGDTGTGSPTTLSTARSDVNRRATCAVLVPILRAKQAKSGLLTPKTEMA